MSSIKATDLLRQLKNDLIGKDSERGVTLTYSWLANQFGHFGLGYIPATVLYFTWMYYWPCSGAAYYSSGVVMLAWTLFEAYNYIGTLYKLSRQNTFQPAWLNVGFDTATDLLFFYLGSLSSCLLFSHSRGIAITIIVELAALFFIGTYWYKVKMYMQQAGFPFQMRLSVWPGTISGGNKKKVQELVAKPGNKHILIIGSPNSGKTSLGVSLSTEWAIKDSAVVYTTGIKFSSMLSVSDRDLMSQSQKLWSWRMARAVVIDDINCGEPTANVISPDYFSGLTSDPVYSTQNIEALRDNSFMWIIGKTLSTREQEYSWINFLVKCGVDKGNIVVIEL